MNKNQIVCQEKETLRKREFKNDRERDSMRETNSHDVKRMEKRQIFNKNLRWVKETSKINAYLEEIDRGRQK